MANMDTKPPERRSTLTKIVTWFSARQRTPLHRQTYRVRGTTKKVVDGIRAKVLLSKLEDGVRMDEPLLSRETSDGALH